MPSVFFLRYVFVPVWHSSAQTTCGSRFLEKEKRERKKKIQSLPVLHQDPLWQLRGEPIQTSVLPCYHHATLRSAHSVPGMENAHGRICHSKGPSD